MILTISLAVLSVAVLSAVSVNGFAGRVVPDLKRTNQAKKDTSSEYQKFKQAAELKIRDLDNDIAKLKAKARKEGKETQAQYNKDVAALEKKSSDLKKELEREKQIDKAKFDAFKKDFDKSMEELRKSIDDLFSNQK